VSKGGLVGNTAVYSLGSILTQLVSFLLLPLYTRILTQADYGALSVLLVVQSIVAIFAECSLTAALFRHYHGSDDPQTKRRLTGMVLRSILLFGGALVGSLWLASEWLGPMVIPMQDAAPLFRLAALSGAVIPVGALYLRTQQAEGRAARFVVASFVQFLASVGATLVLVAGLRWGVRGVLVGQLAGSGVMALFSLLRLGSSLRTRPFPHERAMLWRFALPLVPTSLGAVLMALSDRFFLEKLHSLEVTGVYSVVDKIVVVLQSVLILPFTAAFTQYAFSRQNDPALPSDLAKVLRLYAAVGGALIVGYSLFAYELLSIATTSTYASAFALVVPLVVAPYSSGLIAVLATGLHLANKTRYTPALFGAAVGTNLALNSVLIAPFGAMGAALATAASAAVNAGLYFVVVRRVYPAPYPTRVLLATLVVLAAVSMAHLGLAPEAPRGLELGWFASRVGLLALLCGGLFAVGAVQRSDLRALAGALRRVTRRAS
jgi:O-antigen/teichoic acid export membrane protein